MADGSRSSIHDRRRCSATVLSVAACAARAGRPRHGDRAGGCRRRRAHRCRGRRRRSGHRLCGDDGRRRRAGIEGARRVARRISSAKSRLRVAGPNCMGAYSLPRAADRLSQHRARAGSARLGRMPVPIRRHHPVLDDAPAADRGLRFSYCVTSGNELDLDLADYLNFLVDDPRHAADRAVHRRHPPAARRSCTRPAARSPAGKPILAIKTGATAKSQAAAQSHTGAIGGDYAAYLAMCERYGIVNCRSLDDMVEDRARVRGRAAAEGAAHRLRHHLGRHRRSALRLCRGRRRGDARLHRRRPRPRSLPMHAGRHRAEKSARRRHSDRRSKYAAEHLRDRGAAIPTSTWSPGPRPAAQGRCLGRRDAVADNC